MKDDLTLIIAAVRYIEGHLKEKLTLEAIADQVGFSKYYFTRLFTRYTGQSPYDYYRGRKLTETILHIQKTQCRIIDAAYEYGFSSPEVFARACATVFGKPPSAIRREMTAGTFHGVDTISEGYLWFANSYDWEPKLQFLEGLDLAGVGYFSEGLDESLYNMPVTKLRSVGHRQEGQTFKVTWLEKQAMGFMNFIGRHVNEMPETEMLLTKSLPKMAYLVFRYDLGVDDLKYFYQYVFSRVIPEKGYEVMMPLAVEVLAGTGSRKSSQMYIPVVPSASVMS